MKVLSTIHKIENAESLLTIASGLVVGLKGFSTRETSLLTIKEFTEIANLAKEKNKELYISLKPLLYNSYYDGLKELFKTLNCFYYTGVIVGDIGYYYLLNDLGVKNIIYNPETLLTNKIDFNSYFDIGIKGAFAAKEINKSDVIEIAKNKKGKMFIYAHGHLNMFYSKRKLLKSYFKHIDKIYNYENKKTLTIEELKKEGRYPIIEDEFGTHIFRKNVSTVIKYLKELKDVDYFLIDSLFKDDLYSLDIIKMFNETYNEDQINKLMNKYNEKWDDGFFDLKTIYKKDEES